LVTFQRNGLAFAERGVDEQAGTAEIEFGHG
jgi:hypothetical protein